MELKGRKRIALGERDGVQSPALAAWHITEEEVKRQIPQGRLSGERGPDDSIFGGGNGGLFAVGEISEALRG